MNRIGDSPLVEHTLPMHVLLIDDDEEDALLTRELCAQISDRRIHLEWVSDYHAALAALERGSWDACLLDLRLGEHNGLELLETVIARGSDVPIIMLTGHGDYAVDIRVMLAGAADYLAKDEITPRLLERSLRHAVERRRLQAESRKELRERERAEAALRDVVAQARCVLWDADVEDHGADQLDWRLRFFDQAAAQRFLELDLSGDVTFSQAWLRSRAPEDRSPTDLNGDRCIRLGRGYTQEFRYANVRGELRWLREDVKVETLAPGHWRAVGVCTDITDRKQAEVSLRESHAILKAVAEGAADAIFVKNREGRYLMINSAGARFMGKTVEEVIGRHDSELFSPDSVSDVLDSDGAVYATGQTNTFEEMLSAAGVTRIYHATKGPLLGPDGEIIGLIGISRDVTDRRKAEVALRESEARFRAMAECAPVGIYLTDVHGDNVYANPTLQQQAGRSAQELAGDLWVEAVHPDDFILMESEWTAAVADALPFEMTFRWVRPDGGLAWIHTRAAAVLDGDQLLGYVGMAVDITARREAEQALRDSEARYRFQAQLLHAVGQAVIATRLDGSIFFWNAAAERIYGWSAQEAVGRSITLLTPAEAMLQAEEILSGLFRGESWTGELTLQHRSGACFPALVTNTPIFGERGELSAVLGISTDISERKAAEHALRESEARFHAIFDQAAVAMARVDRHGCILECNPALERMLGYPADELRETPFAEITHPEDVANDRRHFQEMMAGERECYQLEKRFRHRDGREVWGRLTASLVRGAEGQPLFGIGMVEDVSEQKELQERFRQAQRMEAVGRLAGGVAHDFNNMLAVISGYSELMLSSLGEGSPLLAYALEINKAGSRAADLTRQLLAFSRKQLLEPKVFDLNATVHRMDKMLRRLIGEDIELVTLADARLHRIKADASQIEQVIMNLVINARDAMPVGGMLSLQTANVEVTPEDSRRPELPPGSYACLTVRDTGVGIAPEVLPLIFEPFFTTKEIGKGTGLGLATVYGIVRQSGGTVTVESELGQGTAFTVLLPAVLEETRAESQPEAELLVAGSETILLTEDDPMVRGLVETLLTQCGYQVLSAMHGEEALRIALSHRGVIHLLLTDVVMPIMSGRELAQALRDLRPDLPVLYMSGYTDDAMLRHGVMEDGVELLEKPFTPTELAQRVRRMLDAAQQQPAPGGLVLIVDDDAVSRATLGEILQGRGFEVAEAGDGQEAFALLRDGLRPDVIVLDLMMPGMNGWVFRLEQRNTPELADIPVVVTSGEFDPASVEEFLQPAATFAKPLDVDRLVDFLVSYRSPR